MTSATYINHAIVFQVQERHMTSIPANLDHGLCHFMLFMPLSYKFDLEPLSALGLLFITVKLDLAAKLDSSAQERQLWTMLSNNSSSYLFTYSIIMCMYVLCMDRLCFGRKAKKAYY